MKIKYSMKPPSFYERLINYITKENQTRYIGKYLSQYNPIEPEGEYPIKVSYDMYDITHETPLGYQQSRIWIGKEGTIITGGKYFPHSESQYP